ncbi:hypothetical protein VTN02DRAFT_6126 [Thermoascus thermophilus]
MGPERSPLDNIPEIILLCKEQRFITAFHDALATHWPEATQSHPEPHPERRITIRTLHATLRTVPPSTRFQLIVSPANSYGRLDGAFDDAISRAFCLSRSRRVAYDTLTEAAQRVLYERWRGFAPPGSCTLVRVPRELMETDAETPWGCKWVALCPTMRAPGAVVWDREIVYECVWSLLCEVERWNRDRSDDRIETMLMTPLATGVGAVSAERWAAQFVLALKHFVDALERPGRWSRLDWGEIEHDVLEVEGTWRE